MVKYVIMNPDSSKESFPDCIPMVVLKNCRPELSYILAEFFNMCVKESCFADCWKVSFGCPMANFSPFSRGQPHQLNANHCVLSILTQKSLGA